MQADEREKETIMKKQCLTVVLVILSVAFSPFAKADDDLRTISVKGEATVQSAPDKADLSINLFGSGKTAVAAKQESDKKLKSLYKLVSKYGIESSAVRTTQSSVQPQYDYRDGKRVFREYQSQHRISLEIDKLDVVAELTDELVDAGVDRVDSLQYGLKNDAMVKQEALVKALEQARKKAAALAKVAGAKLGHAVSITEGGASLRPPMPMQRGLMKAEAMMAADSAVAPPAGDVEIYQSIHAVFELDYSPLT